MGIDDVFRNEREQIVKLLTGKEGQQVLTVSKEEKCTEMCHGMGNSDCSNHDKRIKTSLHLGVLASEPELTEGTGLHLPINPYVWEQYGEWKLHEGALYLGVLELSGFGKTMYPSDRTESEFQGLIIHTGPEVEAYFRRGGMAQERHSRRQRFGMDEPKIDMSYAQALRLLEQKVPLDFLTDKELVEDYRGEIEGIVQKCLQGTATKETLERAVELRIHGVSLTLPGEQPGIEINVPAYIRGQCKQHGIEIPTKTI